jgi:photosystem II stability/assembly factor-like uncharacterized protein
MKPIHLPQFQAAVSSHNRSLRYTAILLMLFANAYTYHAVGQIINWQQTNGPYGGNTVCVVQITNGELYAADLWSGVYRSTDTGTTWILSSEGLPQTNNYIYAMVFDSLHQRLVVGTNNDIYYRDLGSSSEWARDPSSNAPQTVSKIGISPSDGTIYALASNSTRLYRRLHTDSAWTIVYSAGYLSDFLVDPQSDILYIPLSENNVTTVLRSTDRGNTWRNVIDSLAPSGSGVSFVAGMYGEIYAAAGKKILVSIDSGATWSDVTSGLRDSIGHTISVGPDGDLYATNATREIYHSTNRGELWERYDDGSNILSPGMLWFLDDTIAFTSAKDGRGIARSIDQGRQWESVTHGITGLGLYTIWGDQQNTLYTGTGYPVLHRSTATGENWTRIELPLSSATLVITSFARTADGGVMVGTWKGIVYSADGEKNWELRNTGFRSNFEHYINRLVILPSGKLFVATGSGVFRSVDAGRNWYQVGLSGYTVSALAATSNGILYAETPDAFGSPIWRSIDSGQTWEQIVPNMLTNDLATLSDSTVFAATPRGVLRSTDQGVTWNRCPISQNDTNFIAVDVNQYGPVLAATAGAVYASFDNGQTWSNQSEGLRGRISDVAFDNEGRALVSTWGGGVFVSSQSTSSVSEERSATMRIVVAPNPVHSKAVIEFQLEAHDQIVLDILDATGKQVAVLLDEHMTAEQHVVSWDTQEIPSGLYYVRLISGLWTETRSIVLVK